MLSSAGKRLNPTIDGDEKLKKLVTIVKQDIYLYLDYCYIPGKTDSVSTWLKKADTDSCQYQYISLTRLKQLRNRTFF